MDEFELEKKNRDAEHWKLQDQLEALKKEALSIRWKKVDELQRQRQSN